MPVHIKRDRSSFYAAVKEAFKQTSEYFAEETSKTIKTKIVWDAPFPNATRRKNGEVVPKGRTRNTVDTAELLNSLQVEEVSDYRTRFTWKAKHASSVYFGYKNKRGQLIPARRWVDKTRQRVDFTQIFRLHLSTKL